MQSIISNIGINAKLTGLICIITFTTIAIVLAALIALDAQMNDGTVINIAGRQRMLTQKISKESLSIAAGINIKANITALQKTYQLFDSSHNGLISGNQQLNLPPTTDSAAKQQMTHVDGLWKSFSGHVRTIIDKPRDSAEFHNSITTLQATNVTLLKEMNNAVGLYEIWSKKKIERLRAILFAGSALVILVTIGCRVLISRRIVKPIQQVNKVLQDMERGRFLNRLNLVRKDEIGQMAKSMDALADSLQHEITESLQLLANGDLTFEVTPRDEQDLLRGALAKLGTGLNSLLSQIQAAGHELSSGSDQISNGSQELSHRATTSSAALQELTSSMVQLASQTKHNTENADQANRISSAAKTAAEKGNTQMQTMVSAMREINEAGQDITKIIKVIDEIAFQTNLLALNAAVEAARAGQHGKGFAVVAEEVRNLAARSAKAAQETTNLIEGSAQKAQNGAEIADSTAGSLLEIVESISRATDLVASIAAASNKQTDGINHISKGLERIDEVIQMNTASSEEGAATAEQLSSQSDQLHYMLQRFRIKNGPHQSASPANTSWSNEIASSDLLPALPD